MKTMITSAKMTLFEIMITNKQTNKQKNKQTTKQTNKLQRQMFFIVMTTMITRTKTTDDH